MKTFLMIVGSTYDERRPDAMMVARQGYCNAFEQIGIPYLIVDIRDLSKVLPKIKNPFCMLYSSDLGALSSSTIKLLRDIPLAVWVHPWFSDSDDFFYNNGLDKTLWDTPDKTKKAILDLNPKFIFSATLFPSQTNKGQIKSLTDKLFSLTILLENSFIRSLLSRVVGN